MFTTIIATIFTLVLIAGVPVLSYTTARNTEVRSMPRLGLYLSAVFSQWVLTIVGLGIVFFVARKVFTRGFARMPVSLILEWGTGISLAALLALGMVIWCERQGWLPRETDLVYQMMPESTR